MNKKFKMVIAVVVLIFLSAIYAWGDTAAIIYDKVYDTDNSDYKSTGIVYDGAIEQHFVTAEDNLNGIMLKTIVLGDVTDVTLSYKVLEESSGSVCAEGRISADEFKNDKFKKINFDKINNSKEKSYKLVLEQENASADNGLGFYFVPRSKVDCTLYVRGNETDGTILMRTLTQKFNTERFVVLLVFIIYITVFLKVLYKLFK